MKLCDIYESHWTIFVLNTNITGRHNEIFYYYNAERLLESVHPPWQLLLVAFSPGEIWQSLHPSSKKIKTMLNVTFMPSWHGAWTQKLQINSII